MKSDQDKVSDVEGSTTGDHPLDFAAEAGRSPGDWESDSLTELNGPRSEFVRDCGLRDGIRFREIVEGRAVRDFVVPSAIAIAGALDTCELVLSDSRVDDRHAVVVGLDGRLLVCDLGSESGTFHAGERLRAKWFEGSAEVRFGRTQVRIDVLGEASSGRVTDEDLASEQVSLVFQRRNAAAVRYPLKRRVSLIGREQSCKIQLQSRSVRPYHAVLIQGRSHLWVGHIAEDGDTFVDGQPVTIARLSDQQELSIGRISARVQFGDGDLSKLQLGAIDEPSQAPRSAPPVIPGGVSEEFVTDVLHEFRQMQRETLREMRGWMTEMIQVLATRPAIADARPMLPPQPPAPPVAASPVPAAAAPPPMPVAPPPVVAAPPTHPVHEPVVSPPELPLSPDIPVAVFDNDIDLAAMTHGGARLAGDQIASLSDAAREEMSLELKRRLAVVDRSLEDGEGVLSSVRRWLGGQNSK